MFFTSCYILKVPDRGSSRVWTRICLGLKGVKIKGSEWVLIRSGD